MAMSSPTFSSSCNTQNESDQHSSHQKNRTATHSIEPCNGIVSNWPRGNHIPQRRQIHLDRRPDHPNFAKRPFGLHKELGVKHIGPVHRQYLCCEERVDTRREERGIDFLSGERGHELLGDFGGVVSEALEPHRGLRKRRTDEVGASVEGAAVQSRHRAEGTKVAGRHIAERHGHAGRHRLAGLGGVHGVLALLVADTADHLSELVKAGILGVRAVEPEAVGLDVDEASVAVLNDLGALARPETETLEGTPGVARTI